jgi:hypothetical protein
MITDEFNQTVYNLGHELGLLYPQSLEFNVIEDSQTRQIVLLCRRPCDAMLQGRQRSGRQSGRINQIGTESK